jgi:hypothetical protein
MSSNIFLLLLISHAIAVVAMPMAVEHALQSSRGVLGLWFSL